MLQRGRAFEGAEIREVPTGIQYIPTLQRGRAFEGAEIAVRSAGLGLAQGASTGPRF